MLPPFWVIKKLFYFCDSEYTYSVEQGHGKAEIEGHKVTFMIDSDGNIFHIAENNHAIDS